MPGFGPLVIDQDSPGLRAWLDVIAPGSRIQWLGGTMSRNIHLVDAGLVARVHPPHVTRQRVTLERHLKHVLNDHGLIAARPMQLRGRDTWLVDHRIAEVEAWIPDARPAPASVEAYQQMINTTARVHAALEGQHITRPRISTYGPPTTLRRHLALLARRDLGEPARREVHRTATLVGQLEHQWIPASVLPNGVVHGDIRLENMPLTRSGEPVVMDLGFAAQRPYALDLGYACAWILLGPTDAGPDWATAPEQLEHLLATYQETNARTLDETEPRAIRLHTAATCLYLTTVAAFLPEPDHQILAPGPTSMRDIAHHILTTRH